MNKNRRKTFFANKLHRDIFFMVAFASIIPSIITTIALYYLIFNITADEIGIPEVIAYHILPASQKVTSILLITIPITIVIILMIAKKVSHGIVGPFDRIMRALDKRLEGKENSHIKIRTNDKFFPLVDKINKLLDKVK
ncbi:MAG: hypothetical protein ABIG92_00065 [Candidatus Omnitrophota bacterium]